jgi:hypothetical protein
MWPRITGEAGNWREERRRIERECRIRRLLRQKFTELEYPDKRCPGGCPVTCNRASVRLQYWFILLLAFLGLQALATLDFTGPIIADA